MIKNKIDYRSAQRNTVQYLMDMELEFANKIYPPFQSEMEALGVIQEEYDEAMDEIEGMRRKFNLFKKCLRNGESTKNELMYMSEYIHDAINELIQVAAMLQKFEA